MSKERETRTKDAYEEYVQLRSEGHSHDSAIFYFDYLHPVSLSSLEKYISEHYEKEKGESA